VTANNRVKLRHVPQQHIHRQGRVNLPSNHVVTVTEKTAELEALLYLFEEHLDVPAAAIEILSPLSRFCVNVQKMKLV
jgi:hypothetical protein